MNNKTLTFAREEFFKYAKKTFTDFCENEIYVGLPQNGEIEAGDRDEVYIDVEANAGVILGSNPCATLIAVYRFFKECGCRFLRPGTDGEYIKVQSIKNVKVKYRKKPSLHYRGVYIEGACSYENIFDIIDYSPKIGLNRYCFQFKDSGCFFDSFYGGKGNPKNAGKDIPTRDHSTKIKEMYAAVKLRGMSLQTMGHGFTAYPFGLDVAGWEEYKGELPEDIKNCFALVNGKRGLNKGKPFLTSLCMSNPLTKQKLADWVVGYCKENPEIDVVDFALEDAINVNCECENCRNRRVSDLTLEMLCFMDKEMTKAGVKAKMLIPAYLATLWAPKEKHNINKDRFFFGFYPITRNYYNPLPTEDIPDSEPREYVLNKLSPPGGVKANLQFLKAWQKVIDADWIIGEYHLMWCHYSDIGYQHIAKVLYCDIRNQHKIGTDGMLMYMPNRNAMPCGLPLYILGEAQFDDELHFEDIRNDYFPHYYGENYKVGFSYLDNLSTTFDMIINWSGRDYRPDDCIEPIKKTIALAEGFLKEYGEEYKNHELDVEKTSWHDLTLYSEFIVKYLNAFLVGLFGDRQKGNDMIGETVVWMYEIESEVQPRWDIYVHQRHLYVWYDRVMDEKARLDGIKTQTNNKPADGGFGE